MNHCAIFLIVIIGFSLNSCKTDSGKTISYEISYDSVLVENFDDLGQFQYIESGGYGYLLLHNRDRRILQFVNLTGNINKMPIELPQIRVPNDQINSLKSFYYLSHDSIFLLHSYSLSIIDSSGNLKFQKIINSPEKDDWPETVYGNFLGVFPIHYNRITKQLLMRQHCGPCGNSQNFFDQNVLAAYDFGKNRFIDQNIPFPERYKREYLGDAILVSREIKSDSVLFNFQADPKIYILDMKSKRMSDVTVRSEYQVADFPQLDSNFRKDINRRSEHLIKAPLYLKILYDQYRKVYYRLFLNSLPLQNTDGTFNDFNNKELILMVLDENLKVISEKIIGNGFLWNYSFVTPQGLILLRNDFKNIKNGDQDVSKIIFESIRVHLN